MNYNYGLLYCVQMYFRIEESSGSVGGKGRNKQFLSAQEDKVLITAMLELFNDPY